MGGVIVHEGLDPTTGGDNLTGNSSVSHHHNLTTADHVPVYSYEERIFIASVFSLISLCGTIGNSLVIIAVLMSKRLRTPTNVFVVNLAFADLFASMFLSMSVVALLGKNGWPLTNAEWLCKAAGFVLYTCTGTSLFNLAAIAVNRTVLITKPYRVYRRVYAPFKLATMVAMTWLVSFSVILIFPLLDIGGVGYDDEDFTCSDLDGHPKAEYFHMAQSVVFYPVPLITIIICYTVIFRHVKRHIRKQRKNSVHVFGDFATVTRSSGSFSGHQHHPLPGGSSSTAVTPNNRPLSLLSQTTMNSRRTSRTETPTKQVMRHERLDRQQVAITKNLFMIVLVFVLCCSPYCIALLLPGNDHFLLYGGIFILASSAINPVIYGSKHPHFKEVLSKMLRCNYSEIKEPSKLLKHLLKSSRKLQPKTSEF